jgi:RNA polymerase sigma-70 factor (ECF subfamily)
MADDALECSLQSQANMVDEDEGLVSAAREDPEAAGRLYDKYYSEVVGYIYHCTFDHDAAEDLTSNVFLAALRHLGRYRWQRVPLRAWLYRIATNEVRMYWRRQKRVKAIRVRPDSSQSEQSTLRQGTAPPADDSLAAAEQYRLLHQALLQLRMKYRTVIILRYFEDKAMAEISEITGKKEGTVKSQLHRGLAQLQDILVRWGVLPE